MRKKNFSSGAKILLLPFGHLNPNLWIYVRHPAAHNEPSMSKSHVHMRNQREKM